MPRHTVAAIHQVDPIADDDGLCGGCSSSLRCGAACRAEQHEARSRTVLGAAGYNTLNDVLDLEQEEASKLAGMTPELTEQLMAFLQELTAEESADEAPSA